MLINNIMLQNHGLVASPGSGGGSSSILSIIVMPIRNFAVINYFWDRLLGTYRCVEPTRQTAGSSAATPTAAANIRDLLPPPQRLRNPITTIAALQNS